MTPLYLKAKTSTYLIVSLFLLICTSTFSNGNDSNPAFQLHCEESDAYLIYSYVDVSYSESWSSYKRKVSVQSKLVLNNKTGVDQYAFLNLPSLRSKNIKTVSIKTLKADGSVALADSNLVLNNLPGDDQMVDYPIPGVEPGDTIEISYKYFESLSRFELFDFINLYRALPSLNSEYSIRTPPELLVKYKTYNGFPAPQTWANDTIIYCLFQMEQVKAVSENEYTCLPCELPYLYYTIIESEDEDRTWKDIYNQEFNITTQPTRLDPENKSYYNRWKRGVIGEFDDSSKYYKFELLHADIIRNTEMGNISTSEMIKSSGYFLKEKRFDPISIRRIYRQLLEDLEIDYWAVFARSKRSGRIDPYYIRRGEFDHTFFMYENGEGSFNLLYPHETSYKYQINEIPTSIYNTEAVIVKPFIQDKIRKSDKYIGYDLEMAEVDSVIVEVIKLPGMNTNRNYLKQVVYCNIDSAEETTKYKSRFSVSGGLSTDIRQFISALDQDKEMNDFYGTMAELEGDQYALDIDTVTKIKFNEKSPYIYNINAQGTIKNSISYLNDSLVSITLENLIQHSQVESEKDSIDLNYYFDFCYSDLNMYVLNFVSNIEVLNFDTYNKTLKNSYGEYLFTLKQVGNKQLILQSNYKINQDMIPKNDYAQLKQLNELVQEVKNMRLLIKLSDDNALNSN